MCVAMGACWLGFYLFLFLFFYDTLYMFTSHRQVIALWQWLGFTILFRQIKT